MTGLGEYQPWLRLGLIPGLSAPAQLSLLKAFGSPDAVCGASRTQLAPHLKPKQLDAFLAGPNETLLSQTLTWLAEPNNHLITLADADYPKGLLETSDPPAMFYLKGRRALLCENMLAVVGSRHATPQGEQNARAFSEALSQAGLTIVSGMALGIDRAAHEGGLAGRGSSIAVVGTGLDRVYPASNRDLAHQLALHGAILSEYPLGIPALAANFPRRNRLISGMSLGCLVVEAALQSGSLITARLSAEQGREVFAIPGSIHSPVAKGCHALIKQGAKLVETAQDILDELGWCSAPTVSRNTPSSQSEDDPEAARMLEYMGYDPVNVDSLCDRSRLTPDKVCAILLKLELDGQVASLPGNRYQRLA
ncbi:DNA processing protein [Chitinivorax tropicus]|uniref:DNA processing protein n=1 Tax=Chitinivorax tropicus TaxID=714531 RepID=A0A840MG25_9PROT|nr:DNA-processing protein DprA [Chitinivorax tropicus]MBB5017350.1 DNA processing protein [Chitinivorax tropicus]